MLMKENLDTVFPASTTSPPETLNRSLSLWNSLTIGFATVSPVAGLYAIIGVQTVVTGGGWFSALALCLVMQLLVATVYAELSSQIPIAGGAYKWARQLGGAATGTYAGAIYVSSTIAMLTTTAYTGGIWLAIFFGSGGETGVTLVIWGAVFMLICAVLNLVHVGVFKFLISLGVYAEIVGSFGVALLLFFFFRQHEFSELFTHLGTGTAPQPDSRVSGGARHFRLGVHRLRCLLDHRRRNSGTQADGAARDIPVPLHGGKRGALQLRRAHSELQPRHPGPDKRRVRSRHTRDSRQLWRLGGNPFSGDCHDRVPGVWILHGPVHIPNRVFHGSRRKYAGRPQSGHRGGRAA